MSRKLKKIRPGCPDDPLSKARAHWLQHLCSAVLRLMSCRVREGIALPWHCGEPGH